MMAFEVRALKAMERSRKSKGVTKIVDFGILILKNFGKDHKSEILASYYVMPGFHFSLEQALGCQSFTRDDIWLLT